MRILVAEDDEVTRRIVTRHLVNWHYDIVEVSDGQAALNALMDPAGHPPMAILDWMIPKLDGPEICRMLRTRPDAPFVYIILLSGRDTVQDIVWGLDSGADDYLVKPFDPHELRSRIRAGERIIQLQEKLQKANIELRTLALTDELTDRMNRPAILQRLAQEMSRAARQRATLAVFMADIDRFKDVNETYGHAAGDEVIREFANRLGDELRAYDAVGRYGGEEFLCVLPGITWEACTTVANRVRKSVSMKPIRMGSRQTTVTASIGLVWMDANERAEEEEIIRLADRMLHAAKQNGRDRIEILRLSDARSGAQTSEAGASHSTSP